ncbi:MAG: DNRLRE domain-containing protein [Planctomycetia bacterium]|nr:DNRLRE domain-containing protein [Planctomycetia bacterium]
MRLSGLRFGLAIALLVVAQAASAQQAPATTLPNVDFQSAGERLPGSQFLYDAGFDVVDWNHDGKPDIFLFATGTVGGSVNYNEGTPTEPKFGHAVYWPFNSTETEPQTIEHVAAYTFCDLHRNGLSGIIFFDGQLRYCPNTGTKQGPFHWKLWQDDPNERSKFFPGTDRFVQENARFSTGPQSMYWKKGIFARQVLTLTAADWDGDGLEDLLICRFKQEAPGVTDLGAHDQGYRREKWSAWGRTRTALPTPAALAAVKQEDFSGPLASAPERGLYFYKNLGTPEKPRFDAGVEIKTPAGESIAAPNPTTADIDGDGLLDLVSSETAYSCNAFRVDWPTAPHVQWFRRAGKETDRLSAPQPVMAGGEPVRAGTMVKLADFRKTGVNDLLVMDPLGSIRWYANGSQSTKSAAAFGKPVVLRGKDFLRFEFMVQPTIVDWFGPGSRDLILHGSTDHHCKWDLRRTALYRNVAKRAGDLQYEFAGYLNYAGDDALVPVANEERHYEVFGSSLSVYPDDGTGRKRIMLSVGGRLYSFSDLAPDGLTFRRMTPIDIPQVRNRHRGWQDIPVEHAEPVRYIRISNEANGLGNLRDSFLHVLQFEALAGGKNIATADAVEIKKLNNETVRWYQIQNPMNMFTPGNANTDTELKATSWGYFIGPAVITLKAPVRLEKIRFLLSERDSYWYSNLVPFAWQGKVYRAGMEIDESWYQYKIEVSADEKNWTLVTNRLQTEMLYSHPVMVDWNRDGKTDLFLGVTSSIGIYPQHKTYRLYPNVGTNEEPKYGEPIFATNEKGTPLQVPANWALTYGAQCSVAPFDIYGDGKPALLLEGPDGGLDWHRNISDDSTKLQFRNDRHTLSLNGQTITSSQYRFFHWGDVDGDRTADLIDSGFGNMTYYKGVAATAPARVKDLAVVGAGPNSLTAKWSRPPKAGSYELRWSRLGVTELPWNQLNATSGTYGAAPGEKEVVTLTGLPPGETVRVAVRSFGTNQEPSGLSDDVEGVVLPGRRIVLRNGPAGEREEPAYQGAQAVDLFTSSAAPATPAAAPGTAPVAARSIVEVRSQDSDTVKGKEKVILLRFAELPELKNLERATIELMQEPTTTPSPMTTMAVSCNTIATAWDPATATTAQARAGLPWSKLELERGGTCRSFLEPVLLVQNRRRTWDVTEAVRDAVRNRQTSVNLLLRVDYTGHYAAGQSMRFCSPEHASVNDRPRLVLVTK